MTTLALVRAARASISLTPAGTVKADGIPEDLMQDARRDKALMASALKAEEFDGISYYDSPYIVWLETLYVWAKHLSRLAMVAGECRAIMEMCQAMDEAFMVSHDAGLSVRDGLLDKLRELSDTVAVRTGWLLEGDRLRRAVIEELVDRAKAEAVNMAAFE